MAENRNSDALFQKLDHSLGLEIDPHYFSEPHDFRSLIEVLSVLDKKADKIGDKDEDLLVALKEENPAYNKLLAQRQIVADVIEEVVKFQHGGLNNTVEIMTNVVNEYNSGKDDVRNLRQSLAETQQVLTAKKSGQMSMKELWLKKKEAEESLRILRDLEYLKDVGPRIHRLVTHRHYYAAVCNLNHATHLMFGEDLVEVSGLFLVREQLMEMKSDVLESLVLELQNAVLGNVEEWAEGAFDGSGDTSDTASVESGTSSRHHLSKSRKSSTGSSNSIEDGSSSSSSSSSRGVLSLGGAGGRNAASALASAPADLKVGGAGGLDVSGLFEDAAWDLMGVNENAEVSLVDEGAFKADVSHSSIFIRLLVRSVGLFKVEDDTQRMLLDGAKQRFKEVLRKLREIAIVQKTAGDGVSSTHNNNNNNNNNRGGGYYSMGLATPGAATPGRGDPIAMTPGAQTPAASGAAMGVAAKALHAEANEKLFVVYISLLLRIALDILKRMLYVLRLLQMMKNRREKEEEDKGKVKNGTATGTEEGGEEEEWGSPIGATKHREAVLALWSAVESCIVSELQSHFTEQSITDISDVTQKQKQQQQQQQQQATGAGSSGDSGRDSMVSPPNRSSTGRRNSMRGTDSGGPGDVGGDMENFPIFSPSYSLAAPVYPLVQAFADEAREVLAAEEAIITAAAPTTATDGKRGTGAGAKEAAAKGGSAVLVCVSAFLREEFIPLIQLNANTSLREIQLDSGLFCAPASLEEKDAVRALVGSSLTSSMASIGGNKRTSHSLFGGSGSGSGGSGNGNSGANNGGSSNLDGSNGGGIAPVGGLNAQHYSSQYHCSLLTAAAARSYTATHPLFTYWLQLPLHSEMLVTILERQVQGIVATAKEEVERLSYRLESSHKGRLAALVDELRGDPVHDHYRRHAFHTEGFTLRELVKAVDPTRNYATGGGRESSNHSSHTSLRKKSTDLTSVLAERGSVRGRASSTHSQNRRDSIGGSQRQQSQIGPDKAAEALQGMWADLWAACDEANNNLASSTSQEGGPKVIQDFSDVKSLAHVMYTCEWLAKEVAVLYASSVLQHHQNGSSSKSGSTRAQEDASTVRERNSMLQEAVLRSVRELISVADSVLALLRGELQVACVVLLSQLARESSLARDDGGAGSASSSGGGNARESIVASQKSSSKGGITFADEANTVGSADREDPAPVAALFAFFHAYKDTLNQALLPSATLVVLAPLRSALPSFLLQSINMQCDTEMHAQHTANMNVHPSITARAHSRLSKLVVSMHKSVSLLLDSHKLQGSAAANSPSTGQSINEALSAEFDKVRRYMALLAMPQAELSTYLNIPENREDYSRAELHTLWLRINPLQRSSDKTTESLWDKVYEGWAKHTHNRG
jgi:hypothetical protein